ncbi:ThiP Thiamine transport system permease protein [Desulfamplus magnetovallimortis]|uniref:ThiP Thiamine transport system permease protein n=1 Tax=Desulfamplus magnetovallimortis TaxID=1246637 RepID=A0A1W1H4N7_9BACT|nr:iron ABC transporter permease [Desulfamplus magnetovallimortis]SLM27345.1 ThiP Thiamine transport system permease protein [Desulfamplus magnetovallimortis]
MDRARPLNKNRVLILLPEIFAKYFPRRPAILAGFIPLTFLVLFYFYPLTGIFIRSFFDQGNFSATTLLKILNSSRMAGIFWFTLWQATISTILTLVIALPCAWVTGNFDFKGRKAVMAISTLPFVLPTIVVAAAFQALMGSKGVLGFFHMDGSLGMILLAHMFFNFSVVLRITSGFWSSMGRTLPMAASMLGANPLKIFIKVTLPMLAPAVFASSILVFIFCFASFGVIMVLGGPSFTTLEVEIYRQAAHLFNLPVASALSLFQILFTFFMMWIYTSLQKKNTTFSPESEKFSLKKPESTFEKCSVFCVVLFVIFFFMIPIMALLIKSIWYKGSISFLYYSELFLNTSGSIFYISPLNAIVNSLLFACSALVMAIIIGVCAVYTIRTSGEKIANILDPLFMLPLSTSAVTLGFGIIITLDKPPLNFRTSPMLIPIIHTLVAFPFVVRSLLPVLRSIPASIKESAALLGASPLSVWMHIELPVIARALSVGAVFAFTVSLGEFGATIFAARPEYTTIPVTIYKFLGHPGSLNQGQAMAASSLLMLVTAAGFIFIERFRDTVGHEGF